MNQETISTPALKASLKEVRDRFETWRMSNKVRSRIPDNLWQAAVELCKDHSIFRVSKALRLNYNDLKDRVQDKKKGTLPSLNRKRKPKRIYTEDGHDFVELDFKGPIFPSECVLEMEAANGAKLKMHFRGQHRDFDVGELARVFWRQGL